MRVWLAVAMAWALSAGAALAQGQQQEPFRGRFGVIEIAPTPAQATQQFQLITEALDNLAPQRRRRQDVYIVSMGLWSDPVFSHEAVEAEAILSAHFGAEDRSIVLTAATGDVRTYPSPTPTNIALALDRIGAIIDPEEDLVVIFLTSHGSPGGVISIREHDRMWADLRAEHLASLLHQSGIRNRIVIVSSCFAGAFITHLGNDNTIVLTASQHDRSSFGCEPQNEWTFFGDAMLNQSLRSGLGLIESFDSAVGRIATWEQERNLTPPSNPQRSVGPVALEMLQRAERRR